MATWTKNLAAKHTYLLSKLLSVDETYTLLVTGNSVDVKGEVYLGTDLFIGYLEGNKLTFTLEQASDATFLTFYILSSDVEIKTIKLETGSNPTNYKPAVDELLLPLNKDSYMSPSMTYQMNGNILNFDGENVKYVLDGEVVSQKGINLIRNGNFTNETIGWNASYAKGFVNDCFYTLKALGTFSRPYVRYTTDKQCGDIIYVKFNARTNNSLATNISFDVHGTTSGVINGLNRINLPDANTWYEIDDVVNTKTLSGNLRLEIYHSYIDSTTAKDKEMEISNVQLINLTQSYGTGNEPTLAYIQAHPEEFAWTPNPNDLIETVEIKNNLVGDLESLQGNDFEQHEDGVITYTSEAEEGSVVRVDIDGISDQPLRFRNATGEQVVITEHDQVDVDAIKKVEFAGNSVQLADKYREVSGTSAVIAPELHDKNVADKLVIGGNTTQYTESSNVVTDGLQMWLSGRNFSNSPATTVWKDLTGVNNGTASGFEYRTNVYADVVSDFAGKVAGSVVENANIAKWSDLSSLVTPATAVDNIKFGEFSTSNYSGISSLNGVSTPTALGVSTKIPQHLFSFNVIKAFEKRHGNIPSTDQTTAGKVIWLKDNLATLKTSWYGYGTCPTGNFAKVAWWTGAWTTASDSNWQNTANSPSLIQPSAGTATGWWNNAITSDGFIHMLAYTNASDGVTASTIYTDYVSLTLTLSGASGSDGADGVNFDGIDDYIDCGNSKNINFGIGDFTVDVLVKRKSEAINKNALVDKYVAGKGWFLSIEGGVPKIFMQTEGTYLWQKIGSTIIPLNTLTHLVVTVKRDGLAKAYINGVLTGSVDVSTEKGDLDISRNLYIGFESVDSYRFDGTMNGVRLYNRALSDAEILQNYNAGVAIPIPNIAMPQEVKHVTSGSKVLVHGKNLSSVNNFNGIVRAANGTFNSVDTVILHNIPISPEKSYKLSMIIPQNLIFRCFPTKTKVNESITSHNSIYTHVSSLGIGYENSNGVVPAGYNYLTITTGGSFSNTLYPAGAQLTWSNIQLEEGTVATAYEPFKGYQETTIPVTLKSIG